LHQRAAQPLAQRIADGFAGLAIVTEHSDLDQSMGCQGEVGFPDHGIAQSGVADSDDRVEIMGLGAQRLALCGRQKGGRDGYRSGLSRFWVPKGAFRHPSIVVQHTDGQEPIQ
jgi:hypothetical protein